MNTIQEKSAQFIHIETYKNEKENKKKNHNSDVKETHAKGVLSEAKRLDGYISHIDKPEAPRLLYGVNLDVLEDLVDDYTKNAFIVDKNNKKKKLRSDASVLLAGVVSLDKKDINDWDEYKTEAIKFLKEKYKDKLKTVIEHTDESHPHFHFYVVADHDQLLNTLHDGKNATLKAKKEKKGNQQLAYIKAMTEFQDSFYDQVSKKYGFNRLGEKPRSRLPRSEYKALTKERTIKNKIILDKNIIIDEKNKEINALDNKKEKIITNGEKKGYITAIKEFNNKNILNKFIFSIRFNNDVNDENIKIKESNSRIYKRKEFYKNNFNNEVIKNNQLKTEIENFDNYKKINMFLYDLDKNLKPITKKEKENDNRRSFERLNEQIDSIERQLKSESDRAQKIDRAITQNRRRINSFRARINKVSRILLINCYEFFRDLFSIESIETEFERRKNEKIDKFTEEEIKKISDSRKENRRFNNERTSFKIK